LTEFEKRIVLIETKRKLILAFEGSDFEKKIHTGSKYIL
jgi:hypothetical protein